ncbi:MAG: hypothetical protein IPP79_10975 [Chitinophagaceae bacterium]|nr:hypothetical protein [Chitinophagaceae bacterium]
MINLKFKKSVKKGWFGKVYAGGGKGSVGHYEAGGIVNSFRDTLQVSMLGYTNNINKAGFGYGDIIQLGVFNEVVPIVLVLGQRIAINGISFGATGTGIQQSTGAGININHDPSKKVQLNFQYFLGKINSNYNAISNTSQYLEDTVLKTFNNTKNTNEDISQRFWFRLKWKIDSLSSIDFTPIFIHRNRTG